MNKKLISIVTPCFNEELNVLDVYNKVREVYSNIHEFDFEHIFIDNDSLDNTQEILREIAAKDKNVKLIFNERNFGHLRSPFHALLQASGDAAILLVCDLQDPPSLIKEFLEYWKSGYPVVVGVKTSSEENFLMYKMRTFYYNTLDRFSDVKQIKNFTGFGLYDKRVLIELKKVNDPYPYLRGLICELGFRRMEVQFHQPVRKKGVTKNNWFTLYDLAILGFINHSKVPLRLSILTGCLIALFSLIIGALYFIYKLIYWNQFALGIAPVAIGLFFFSAIQLIFLGLIGEYIGATLTLTKKRPLVIERERVNF